MKLRIIDQSEEIVPWILQCRDHDLTTDIHRFLDFDRSMIEEVLIDFIYLFDSPEDRDIFSFWSDFTLEPELIATDIESDIVGLIEVGNYTKSARIPSFRSFEIIDFVDRSAESEDSGSHGEGNYEALILLESEGKQIDYLLQTIFASRSKITSRVSAP